MRLLENGPAESDTVMTEALFLSPLQPSQAAAPPQVRRAAAEVVSRLGHELCAALVAQEYGDHPEVAARRMAWCRRTVEQVRGETLLVIDTTSGEIIHEPASVAGLPARWQYRGS